MPTEGADTNARTGERDLGPYGVLDGARDLGLETVLVGRRVHYLESVESTNAACWELAERGEPAGTVVIADEQTRGRGRAGRLWFSPAGLGIWASILLRPGMAAERLAGLSIVTALSIADALRVFPGVDAGVKWPNDIVVAGRKLGGVLIESGQVAGERVESAVVGLGVNVNVGEHDFPDELRVTATSLGILTGGPVDRAEVLRSVLTRLDDCCRRYVTDGVTAFRDRWHALSTTLGQEIRVEGAGAAVSGTVIGLSSGGALVVRDAEGRTIEIWHGDIVGRRLGTESRA